MTTDQPGHFLATLDWTTQTATTLCGQTRPLSDVPPPGTPFELGRLACAECFSQVIQLAEKSGRDAHNRLVEDHNRRVEDHNRLVSQVNVLNDQLVSVWRRLEALERPAPKKGRRS